MSYLRTLHPELGTKEFLKRHLLKVLYFTFKSVISLIFGYGVRLGQGSSSVFLSLWMSSGPSCPSSADLLLHLSKMSRAHVCPTRPCVRLCAASAVLVTAATQKV